MKIASQLSWLETDDASKGVKSKSYFDELLQYLAVRDDVARWPDAFGSALRSRILNTLAAPIKILSLFSGGGGLDIAFHDAGFDAIQMVELNPRYVETLKLNAQEGRIFEGTEPLCIDIRDFQALDNLQIDFIVGGPPCQTFSAAGRRAAGVPGLDDPRGMLFQEYVRILHELKPKGFLFENVYGIIGAQGGKAWREIFNTFESAGYKISFRILDAADYGVPQHRERLIIVGLQDKYFAFPRPTHGPDSIDQRPYYTSGLAIQDLEDEKPEMVGGRYGYLLRDIPPGLNYSFYTEEMGHPYPHFSWRSKFSDLLYKADPDMPVRTIKAQGGQYTGPFHWDNRPFSIGELKRLQTFPDDYILAGGRLASIEQIGNSVPPQFGRMMAIAVLDQVFGMQFPFKIEYLSPHDELTFRQRKALLTTLYKNKAKEAIANLYPSINLENEKRHGTATTTNVGESVSSIPTYSAYLGADFSWYVKGHCDQEHPWNIEFSVARKEQRLDFLIGEKQTSLTNPFMILEVYPVQQWQIPAEVVRLVIHGSSSTLFTASWKAFEHYISTNKIKADLVQLNGYYQYEPKIRMKVVKFEYPDMEIEEEPSYQWEVLKQVLEGKGVRQIISLEHLASLWDIPVDNIINMLLTLRSLGYEVRSEFTNGQISREHILIPYAFPTLNPKSVQLRKTLFPNVVIAQLESKLQEESKTAKERWLFEHKGEYEY